MFLTCLDFLIHVELRIDLADLRQFIYEQMGRIRTNAFVLDGLYGTGNGHGQDTKGNGNGKEHS